MPKSTVVAGIRLARPPSRSRSRSPVAASTDPALRKPSVLNAAWLATCRSAAIIATCAAGRSCAAESSMAAPIPIVIRPMFSLVENARRRLRSFATDGLQDRVDGGRRPDQHEDQTPPARPGTEQRHVDAQHPVDTHVDHGGAEQRRHRTRRLGMRAGQPGVQRQQPGLRPETHERQQEDGRSSSGGQRARRRDPCRRTARCACPRRRSPAPARSPGTRAAS